MRRLMSRRTVLWDGMGFPSTRHGWMAALLASFLALFVLVSAVDAAACAPEAGRAQAAAASGLTHAVVADADHDKGGGAADHVACAHGCPSSKHLAQVWRGVNGERASSGVGF